MPSTAVLNPNAIVLMPSQIIVTSPKRTLPFSKHVLPKEAHFLLWVHTSVTSERHAVQASLLLKKVLREKWNFKGYVVSDCGAINDIYENHKFVSTPEEAAALAVKAGCDLECGDTYRYLKKAVAKGLLKESDIDISVKRLFTARFKLGLFDPPELVRYTQIPISENDKPEHRELALKAARESIVLLKNDGNFLPLKKDVKTIAVIGPNADVAEVLVCQL